jgi:hypothetical protein
VHELAVVAEHLHRPVEHTPVVGGHARAEVVLDRRQIVGEAREDALPEHLHVQLAQAVLFQVEIGRVATLAAEAPAKWHADQVALGVVGPLVVDAGQRVGVAAQIPAHQRAAVGAAVHQHVELAVGIAGDDDRRVADERGLVVAGLGQLGGQRHVVPGSAAEDALLFELVDGRVLVDAVRHTGVALLGPDQVQGGGRGRCVHDVLLGKCECRWFRLWPRRVGSR